MCSVLVGTNNSSRHNEKLGESMGMKWKRQNGVLSSGSSLLSLMLIGIARVHEGGTRGKR